LLLDEMTVWEAQIDLRGPVPAQLAAQRTIDHQIATGKFLRPGWNAAGAFLACHHIDGWVDSSLLAVVHGHWRIISENSTGVIHIANMIPVVVGGKLKAGQGRRCSSALTRRDNVRIAA
jgi:hypothetical protein